MLGCLGSSRSRLRIPCLATLALGTSAIRMLGTSLVSTTAITACIALSMSQGAGALCAAGRVSDDDDDEDKDIMKIIDKIAKKALFGGGEKRSADDAVRKKNKGTDKDSGAVDLFRDKVNEVLGSGVPAQLSFGFVMGVCCGFAAKKTAKVALVGVGLAFGSLQVLSYLGYVQLDYSKIEGEVMGALDIDKNGKVDTDDIKELYNRAMKVAAYNLPAGSGFAAGAIIGARMG